MKKTDLLWKVAEELNYLNGCGYTNSSVADHIPMAVGAISVILKHLNEKHMQELKGFAEDTGQKLEAIHEEAIKKKL